MSEWISVKDRLPEKNGNYLVFSNGVTYTAYFSKDYKPSLYTKNKISSPMFYWEDGKMNFFEDTTVTHWMILIDPPRIKK